MKRRKTTPTGRTNPRILILCDGLTEKNYFTAIKQDPDYKRALAALSVDIMEAKKSEPLQIVEEALKKQRKARQERNEYNHVWVVFDHDNRPSLLEAYKLANTNGISIAFSSIAYEYWYLLHFKQTAKVYPTAEPLIKDLEKHIANYRKGCQNDFLILKDKLPNAQQNATWLRAQMRQHLEVGKHLTSLNPFTDVDELVAFLLAIDSR